jgi:hypothetical protein
MDPDDTNGTGSAPSNLGRRAQIGGALAAFIGVLLLVLGPAPTPGGPLNPHQLAYLFIGFGVLLVVVGTIARLLFLD